MGANGGLFWWFLRHFQLSISKWGGGGVFYGEFYATTHLLIKIYPNSMVLTIMGRINTVFASFLAPISQIGVGGTLNYRYF